jgi:hypothetical protein
MNISVKKKAVDHVVSYHNFLCTIKVKKNLIHKKSTIMLMILKIEAPEDR